MTKAPWAPLYKDLLLQDVDIHLSYATRLPAILDLGNVIIVGVPGGIAYVAASDVAVYKSVNSIPGRPAGTSSPRASCSSTKPTLWGGTMGIGYDCSGFTSTIYKSHGIDLPRDAGPQAYFSDLHIPVDMADVTAGDLIFYASNISNPHTIYHVAMYAEDGNMVEAYASGTPVRVTPRAIWRQLVWRPPLYPLKRTLFRDHIYWGSSRLMGPKRGLCL